MGKAEDRAKRYFDSNVPFGCVSSDTCIFQGTKESFESERQISVQNCAAATRGAFLGPSDKTRINACQLEFDKRTLGIRFDNYGTAAQEKANLLNMIAEDNPIIYLIAFGFVAVIIYLLLS